MSLLIAGIMAGVSVLSTQGANRADRDANEISKFQDLLDVEQLAGDVSLQEYNSRRDLASLESEQVATMSAMGKRTSGEGFKRMQDVGREDMESNIARNKEQVARAREFGKVSASAKDSATRSRIKSRNIGAVSSGLLSLTKAFK